MAMYNGKTPMKLARNEFCIDVICKTVDHGKWHRADFSRIPNSIALPPPFVAFVPVSFSFFASLLFGVNAISLESHLPSRFNRIHHCKNNSKKRTYNRTIEILIQRHVWNVQLYCEQREREWEMEHARIKQGLQFLDTIQIGDGFCD